MPKNKKESTSFLETGRGGILAPCLDTRASGVLMHVTSLPGPFGIGDLGGAARRFIDFLVGAEQRYWQMLPLVPTCGTFGHSPYTGFSVFAGSQLLIDPQWLVDHDFLDKGAVLDPPVFSEYQVDYSAVEEWKAGLLSRAFAVFEQGRQRQAFERFCAKHPWLEDHALFIALLEDYDHAPWFEWSESLVFRRAHALRRAAKRLEHRILYHKFVQFCFFSQLDELRDYAAQKGVLLIGDIPIYVALNSVDVWANQECFVLDELDRLPTHVAGVPPDYFSDTGQRWGNPLYRWEVDGQENEPLLDWWQQRFSHIFHMVDVARVDHFRGFEAYWEIPVEEEFATAGHWVKGPGLPFFQRMQEGIGGLPIIAEDLGVITPEVEKLRDEAGFPGMKILQFAFDANPDNPYLPHNFTSPNCVVYTGTHDNDTVVGWFFDPEVSLAAKQRAERYANRPGSTEGNWDFIRMAFASIARTAIIPLQDVLGFGGDCRMNRPSVAAGNWQWRCAARFLTDDVRERLADETRFYSRGRR